MFKRKIAEGLFLAEFTAPWCASCRMQAPIIARLSARYAGKLQVIQLNVDRCRDAAEAMGVTCVPTLAVFRDGAEIQRFTGLQSEDVLSAAVDRAMALTDPRERRR